MSEKLWNLSEEKTANIKSKLYWQLDKMI
jgi:hypothetical protein